MGMAVRFELTRRYRPKVRVRGATSLLMGCLRIPRRAKDDVGRLSAGDEGDSGGQDKDAEEDDGHGSEYGGGQSNDNEDASVDEGRDGDEDCAATGDVKGKGVDPKERGLAARRGDTNKSGEESAGMYQINFSLNDYLMIYCSC